MDGEIPDPMTGDGGGLEALLAAAERRALMVWASYFAATALFAFIAWRTHGLTKGLPIDLWARAGWLVYLGAAASALAALWWRPRIYEQARQRLAQAPSDLRFPTVGGGSSGMAPTTPEHLEAVLAWLVEKERSLWTLAVGPAVVGVVMVVLSADATPYAPLVIAAVVLLGLTRPDPRAVVARAGAFAA